MARVRAPAIAAINLAINLILLWFPDVDVAVKVAISLTMVGVTVASNSERFELRVPAHRYLAAFLAAFVVCWLEFLAATALGGPLEELYAFTPLQAGQQAFIFAAGIGLPVLTFAARGWSPAAESDPMQPLATGCGAQLALMLVAGLTFAVYEAIAGPAGDSLEYLAAAIAGPAAVLFTPLIHAAQDGRILGGVPELPRLLLFFAAGLGAGLLQVAQFGPIARWATKKPTAAVDH